MKLSRFAATRDGVAGGGGGTAGGDEAAGGSGVTVGGVNPAVGNGSEEDESADALAVRLRAACALDFRFLGGAFVLLSRRSDCKSSWREPSGETDT